MNVVGTVVLDGGAHVVHKNLASTGLLDLQGCMPTRTCILQGVINPVLLVRRKAPRDERTGVAGISVHAS